MLAPDRNEYWNGGGEKVNKPTQDAIAKLFAAQPYRRYTLAALCRRMGKKKDTVHRALMAMLTRREISIVDVDAGYAQEAAAYGDPNAPEDCTLCVVKMRPQIVEIAPYLMGVTQKKKEL